MEGVVLFRLMNAIVPLTAALAVLLSSGCTARVASKTAVPAAPPRPPSTPARSEGNAGMRHFLESRGLSTWAEYNRNIRQAENEAGKGKLSGARPASAGEAQWVSIGPQAIGGLTNGIVVHPERPDTVYTSTRWGGIWKTTDAGVSWTALTDNLPSLQSLAVVMDPRQPDTLYVPFQGGSLYVTKDGGESWERLSPTGDYTIVRLVPSKTKPNRLYAAADGVYLSTDGGRAWTQLMAGYCDDLAVAERGGAETIVAACTPVFDEAKKVFRNVNGGEGAWETVLDTNEFRSVRLSVSPANPDVVYLHYTNQNNPGANYWGGLYRSLSAGAAGSWEKRFTFDDGINNSYCQVLAADPVSPDMVWLGGQQWHRSRDGGATWERDDYWPAYSHPDQQSIAFHPGYNGTSNQTVYMGNDGGIYRIENARAAFPAGSVGEEQRKVVWKPLNNGYVNTMYYHGLPYPGGGAHIGGSQDNATMSAFSDGPGQAGFMQIGGDGGFVAFDPNNPDLAFGWYNWGPIARRINGRWLLNINDGTFNFPFATPIMLASDANSVWIGGHDSIWLSRKRGETWERAFGGKLANKVTAIAVRSDDPNTVIAGTQSGLVFLSRNALAAPEERKWITYQTPKFTAISDIQIDPRDSNSVYMAAGPFFFRSDDGGASWRELSSLRGNFLRTILLGNPDPRTIFVGTDRGIYVSNDGGSSWVKDGPGLPNVIVNKLAREATSGAIFAFTHGRGVWRLSPSPARTPCSYDVSPKSFDVPVFGGVYRVKVDTQEGCSWFAEDIQLPVQVTSKLSGVGPGTVEIVIGPRVGSPIEGVVTIRVAWQQVEVKMRAKQVWEAIQSPFPFEAPAVIDVFPLEVQQVYDFSTEPGAGAPIHSCTGSADYGENWYVMTPRFSGVVNLIATAQSFGDLHKIVLAGYQVDEQGRRGNELACVSAEPGGPAVHALQVEAGQTYAIQVSDRQKRTSLSFGGFSAFTPRSDPPQPFLTASPEEFQLSAFACSEPVMRSISVQSLGADVSYTASVPADSWLTLDGQEASARQTPGEISLTADPAKAGSGVKQTAIRIRSSEAANGGANVLVRFFVPATVIQKVSPTIRDAKLSPGSRINIAPDGAWSASFENYSQRPVKVSQGGVSLRLTDSAGVVHDLDMYAVSQAQITALLPGEAALGTARLRAKAGPCEGPEFEILIERQ
ncbi:MAG: hypothetical protein HZB13_15730 [Acidobacteria bacterium]|nr:hypothetical protein [Acidobacteriota bacterium]